MQTTTNYGLNIVEGTDIVNPLTQLNPNFTALDTDLKAVSDLTIDAASCVKTGTVHAVTRTLANNIFKFTATGNWVTGDTMTVDGISVSVFLADGEAPLTGAYVINSEVLCILNGTRVTLFVNQVGAGNVNFSDTNVRYTASDVQEAIEKASTAAGTAYTATQSVSEKIGSMNDIQYEDRSYTTDANGYANTGLSLTKVVNAVCISPDKCVAEVYCNAADDPYARIFVHPRNSYTGIANAVCTVRIWSV